MWVLSLILTVGFASAQRYTITGTMVDSLNNSKIFYATIGLMTTDSNARMVANAYSENNGKFSLSDVPAGEYLLKANLVGYEMLTLPVTVGGDKSTIALGDVYMNRVSNFLKEVNIQGEKPVYMMDGEKTLYNVADDPTIQSGTASDALQNAPGVEVDVDGNITLRGVSSVEIWLNNKPSNMNEEALKQFIQQMPAGTIEKIEVITNPSARYSAQGTGGIINIITTSKIKKNSFLSVGARGSSTPDITPYLSYVYGNDKFTFSAYANYSFNVFKGSGESSSVMYDDNKDTSSTFQSTNSYRNVGHRGGIYLNGDYSPDTMNTFSFWAGGYPSVSKGNSFNHTQWFEYLYDPGDYSYLDTSSSRNPGGGAYGGLWYEHKFNSEGHKISADVSYWGHFSTEDSRSLRDFTSPERLDRDKHTQGKYIHHGIDVSTDYTIPYHKNGEIELGVSGNYNYSYEAVAVDTLVLGTTEYQHDSLRSPTVLDQGGGFNAYATLQHRFGGFTLKGGLRTEYEFYDAQILNSPKDNVKKGYWGLYPSLHLSYRTKSMHNFKLSYTRRVNNPEPAQLTVYKYYSEDSYKTGNPNLLPSYTNSIEAGWTKFFQKFGNVGLNAYFKNTKDEFSNMSDVIYDPIFGRIITFTQPVNAGKSLNTGAEFNMMYRLKSFMNIRFYANMYYLKSSFEFRDQNSYEVENLGYSFRLNFWAKLWKVLEVNASANYRSKSKSLFTTTEPRYSIDCGLRAEFWKKRISVFMNVSDIFNWNKTSTNVDNPYYVVSSTSRNSWFGRSIRAGITFKFGKMELESSQASAQGGGGGGGM